MSQGRLLDISLLLVAVILVSGCLGKQEFVAPPQGDTSDISRETDNSPGDGRGGDQRHGDSDLRDAGPLDLGSTDSGSDLTRDSIPDSGNSDLVDSGGDLNNQEVGDNDVHLDTWEPDLVQQPGQAPLFWQTGFVGVSQGGGFTLRAAGPAGLPASGAAMTGGPWRLTTLRPLSAGVQ